VLRQSQDLTQELLAILVERMAENQQIVKARLDREKPGPLVRGDSSVAREGWSSARLTWSDEMGMRLETTEFPPSYCRA
jgi:hypothetical protein